MWRRGDRRVKGQGGREGRIGSPFSAFRLAPYASQGFTLLEVMVAVAITAFVLVSLIGLSNRSIQDVVLAEHMTTATFLSKKIVSEALIEKSFKSLEEDGGFEEEQFKEYTWKKTVTISEPIEGVQVTEIRVAVLWKEGEREESVELVAYE